MCTEDFNLDRGNSLGLYCGFCKVLNNVVFISNKYGKINMQKYLIISFLSNVILTHFTPKGVHSHCTYMYASRRLRLMRIVMLRSSLVFYFPVFPTVLGNKSISHFLSTLDLGERGDPDLPGKVN